MDSGHSSQAPLRSIGLLDRISAARAGGDIGDASIVAGPGCARARKDVSRRGSLASPQGKKLRLSGASAICDDSDADEEQSLPEGKQCVACKRVTGRDASYYNPQAPFAWLYNDGRGNLCKDCGTVYRQVYRVAMCQPTFLNFLEDRRIEYLGVLLAYVSLRKESSSTRLSGDQINNRKDLLVWLYSLSGYPYPLGALQILAPSQDYLRSLSDGFAVQVLASSQEPQCAVLVTRDLSTAIIGPHAPFVTRQQADVGQPLWPVQLPEPVLQSIMNEQTKQYLHQVCGVDLQRRAIENTTMSDAPASSRSSDAALAKYVDRLEGSKKSLRVTLPGLGKVTKAKEFGTIITKVQKLQVDLLRTPYAQHSVMEEVQAVLSLLQSCFDIVRPLTDFLKTQKKSHLDKLMVHLEPIVGWARRESVVLSEPIESTYSKLLFFDTQRRSGAHEAVLTLQSDSTPIASNVAADCVLTVLYEMMQRVPTTEDDVLKWKRDISGAVASFGAWCASEVPPKGGRQDMKELNEVLVRFKVIVDAAVPSDAAGDVSPAKLRTAFEVMETRTLARKLKDGLGRHFGATLRAEARSCLLAGELDDQYSTEFVEACSHVFDVGVDMSGGLVALAPPQGWSGLGSFKSMRETVCDAILRFQHCMTKWTRVRLCDETPALSEVLTRVALIIGVSDRLLWEELVVRVDDARVLWSETVAVWGTGELWPPAELYGQRLDCSSSVAEPIVVSLAESVVKFVKVLENSDVVVLEADASTAMIALRREAEGFLNNSRVRIAIMDECRLLQDLLDCEVQEPTGAFDGYMRGETCILKVAEQLLHLRDRCAGMSLFDSSIVAEHSHDAVISITEPLASGESVEGVESVMPKSAGDQREILSISDVVLFVNKFQDPVFCQWVDTVHVSACLDAYVKSFLELTLPVLKPFVKSGVVAEIAGGSLSALLEHCLDRASVGEMVRAVSSVVTPCDMNGDCDAYRRTRLIQVSAALVRLLKLRINGPCIELHSVAFAPSCIGDDANPAAAWDRGVLVTRVQAMTQCVTALQAVSFLTSRLEYSSEDVVVASPSGVAGVGCKAVSSIVVAGMTYLNSVFSDWSDLYSKMVARECCPLRLDDGCCCVSGVLLERVRMFIMDTWRPKAIETLCATLVSSIVAEIETLKKEVPTWSDWITFNKYNVVMVRKHLTSAELATSLLQRHTALHTLVSSITTAVRDDLELKLEDVHMHEVCEDAETALDHARTTMAVLAGVNLVELPATSRKAVEVSDKAKKVLTEQGLPASLRAKLQALVHTK